MGLLDIDSDPGFGPLGSLDRLTFEGTLGARYPSTTEGVRMLGTAWEAVITAPEALADALVGIVGNGSPGAVGVANEEYVLPPTTRPGSGVTAGRPRRASADDCYDRREGQPDERQPESRRDAA